MIKFLKIIKLWLSPNPASIPRHLDGDVIRFYCMVGGKLHIRERVYKDGE